MSGPLTVPIPTVALEAEIRDFLDEFDRYDAVLANYQRGSLANKVILFSGDSTISDATGLFSQLRNVHTAPGGKLAGMDPANILNRGNNGVSLAAFLTGSFGAYPLATTLATAADLYVFRWLINDVRLGITTEDQCFTLAVQLINMFINAHPDSDIVWIIPNQFLTANTFGLNHVQGSDGTINPVGAAQAYSDILWRVGQRLVGLWPNVGVFDSQGRVFGRTSQATSVYMQNQLHPNGTGDIAQANALVDDWIGKYEPVSANVSTVARSLSSTAPWTVEKNVLEDPNYFEFILEAPYLSHSAVTNTLTFDHPGTLATMVKVGDIVAVGDNTPFEIPTGAAITASTVTNITGAAMNAILAALTISFGYVRVYKRKVRSTAIESYVKRKRAFPYQRFGRLVSGTSNSLGIAASVDENRTAMHWSLTVGNIIVLDDGTEITLAIGQSYAQSTPNLLIQSLTAGDYSVHVGKWFGVFGTQQYETALRLPASIDPAAFSTLTAYENFAVSGLQMGDRITGFDAGADFEDGFGVLPGIRVINDAGTVKVRIGFLNTTGGSINAAAKTFVFRVER